MVVNLLAVSRFEHLVIWLPALVIGIGLVGAVLILLGRAFATTVRESRHPRLVIGALVGLVMLVVLLSWLGVTLPREG
jgi:membrane-associated phospholipid phosphatase